MSTETRPSFDGNEEDPPEARVVFKETRPSFDGNEENPPAEGVVFFDHAEGPLDGRDGGARRWMKQAVIATAVVGLAISAAVVTIWAKESPGVRFDPAVAQEEPESPAFLAITPVELELAPNSEAHLAVRALGAGRVPLSESAVSFRIESGEGELRSNEPVRTDEHGIAETWVRVRGPGTVSVGASVQGSPLPPIRFSLLSRSGSATQATRHRGNGQRARAAQRLPEPVIVEVTDAAGQPVPDIEVRFESLDGGSVVPSRTRTDSLGLATAFWRLGQTTGEQHLAAIVPAVPENVLTFSALATSALATSAESNPSPAPVQAPPESSRPLALGAAAHLRGERLLLQNGDSFDWRNCRVTLNDDWDLSIEMMPAGQTLPRALAAFVGEGGALFDPSTQPLQKVSMSCDTPAGPLSWAGAPQ